MAETDKGSSKLGLSIATLTIRYNQRFYTRNKTILDAVDLDTPSWNRVTTGLWIDVSASILSLFKAKGINPAEAIHAAQHAFLNRFPLAQDVKTECKAPEKEYKATESNRKRPARQATIDVASSRLMIKFYLVRLIFYDSIGQGGGMVSKAFDNGSSHSLKHKDCIDVDLKFMTSSPRRVTPPCPVLVKKDVFNVRDSPAFRFGILLLKYLSFQVYRALPVGRVMKYVQRLVPFLS